ncbi:MAG: hypothetical protein IJ315_09295, partial [Firmicutes bacterium]|nr:hypothetical protein [Bacillota bacterium]
GTCNWGAPLTTILEYEGISYLKFKDGSSDGIYGFDGEIFTLLDTIAYPDEVKQAKYNAYTVAYSVSTYQQFIDNGPYTLQDTLDTLNSLREQCGIVVEEESFNVEKMLATYRQIVADLEAVHGKTTDGTDGLCMVKLVDLNKDGIDELFCSWVDSTSGLYIDAIYLWKNGEAKQIYTYKDFSGEKTMISWYIGEEAVYVVEGFDGYYNYKRLVADFMVIEAAIRRSNSQKDQDGNYLNEYYLGGKRVSGDEFDALFNSMQFVEYWYGTEEVPEDWNSVLVTPHQ